MENRSHLSDFFKPLNFLTISQNVRKKRKTQLNLRRRGGQFTMDYPKQYWLPECLRLNTYITHNLYYNISFQGKLYNSDFVNILLAFIFFLRYHIIHLHPIPPNPLNFLFFVFSQGIHKFRHLVRIKKMNITLLWNLI